MSNGQEIQEIRGWAAAEFAITLAVERTRDLEVVGPVVLVGDMAGGIAGEQKAFR